jgi:RNA polymerase sigma factor (sigma-70 family)
MQWLAKIIENRVKAFVRFHLKTRKRTVLRETRLDSKDGMASQLRDGRTASSILVEAEERGELRRALLKLSPKQKMVIELVHFEKLRVREAAARLNKTANATSVLLYDALERLGGVLGNDRGKE